MKAKEDKQTSAEIVARLRAVAWQDEAHSSDLYDAAADRIEKLERALLDQSAAPTGPAQPDGEKQCVSSAKSA